MLQTTLWMVFILRYPLGYNSHPAKRRSLKYYSTTNLPRSKLEEYKTSQATLEDSSLAVNILLSCPDFLLQVARKKDWNVCYDNLYDEFRKLRLVPSNHLSRGPDIEFICNITKGEEGKVPMRLTEQFSDDIYLGSVVKLNAYKDHDGKRQKRSFEIGTGNSILDKAGPFAWGLPLPSPIPIGALGGATAGSAMQSPQGTGGSDDKPSIGGEQGADVAGSVSGSGGGDGWFDVIDIDLF